MEHFSKILVMAALAVSGCTTTGDYVFRDQNRPAYHQTVSIDQLKEMRNENVTLLDVRLLEDYQANQELIPGAQYSDPENIEEWSSSLAEDSTVVVYCVKGKWVSQKAAHYLAERGIEVYSLEGGIEAWQQTEQE